MRASERRRSASRNRRASRRRAPRRDPARRFPRGARRPAQRRQVEPANALARRDAAIVSEEAGTTRDVIEVRLDLEGLPVIVSDTAGIREAQGDIEQEGIRRTSRAARDADLVALAHRNGGLELNRPAFHVKQVL